MNNPIVTVEGRRVYVQTRYGDPVVPVLKRLGAHWEPQTKRWWLTSAKKAEVEAAIAASADKPNTADEQEVTVMGKARYKGRSYFVRYVGRCKNGDYKMRLCTLDGKIDFWAKAARPHEHAVTGDGDVARLVKSYEEARSLDSIRRYVERLREAKESGPGTKPDEECYLSNGEWLVRGCGECSRLGRMCSSCRFDVFDQ